MRLVRGKSLIHCKTLSEQQGFLLHLKLKLCFLSQSQAELGVLPVASVHSAEVTAKPVGDVQSSFVLPLSIKNIIFQAQRLP